MAAIRVGLAVVGMTVVVAAAGCGSSSSSSNGEAGKPPAQVLADAKAATAAAGAVRIAGTAKGLRIDLVDGHGTGGGTVTEPAGTVQVVTAGGKVYLRADQATWSKLTNASVGALVGGKWIFSAETNPEFTQLADLTDISQVASSLTPSGTVTVGKVTTFQGQSAVPLIDSGGKQGTLYVAASGQPYILGVTNTGPQGGTLAFSEYGKATPPPAPSGAIDLQSLQG